MMPKTLTLTGTHTVNLDTKAKTEVYIVEKMINSVYYGIGQRLSKYEVNVAIANGYDVIIEKPTRE